MLKTLTVLILIMVSANSLKAQNVDEAKVPDYKLPESLITSKGKKVKTASAWEKNRRPEILELFENHVYGRMPKAYDSLTYLLANHDKNSINGKAQMKELIITAWKKGLSVHLSLTVFIPNNIHKPAPLFLLINNRGKDNTDPSRKTISEFWPAEQLIASGYAIAAFQVDDAAPDDKERYQKGVLSLYPEQLASTNGMKAIGAWAWAASRVMDYFEKDQDIDAKKVFIVGHSRGGKAALWAGAQDERFAIVFSNNSGNTGAALSRRKFGETVQAINSKFPHWFPDNYKMYNENEDKLPVDQHMLISLIAPRPVYITNASNDLWADPKGSYLSLLHARDVYKLYNKPSALTPNPPGVDYAIINSYLGYHNRRGEHNLTLFDWRKFIAFADHHSQTHY